MTSADRVCYVKAKGGMGNRMLCAASGILWARAAGRTCFVDWRDDAYSRAGENSIFHFFDPPNAVKDPPNDEAESVAPAVWKGRLGESVSNVFRTSDPSAHRRVSAHKQYSIDASRVDQAEQTAVFWHYMDQIHASRKVIEAKLNGYRGLNYEQMLGKALREELPLRSEVTRRIDAFADEHFSGRVIGLHIRYSDAKAPVDKCERALERMVREDPDAKIFLATDSREMEQRIRDRYGSVLITEKWLPEGGEAAHQNPDCDEPVENGIEALTDMYLLARCDRLIYARRSTFSFVSACVGDFARVDVVDVDARDPKVLAKRMVRRLVA